MAFLTIFTAPKPFIDQHIAMIQRNAIQSWVLLPDVEIFLIGDEVGLAEAAKEYHVKHLPDVRRNQNGTPLISSMIDIIRRISDSPLLCIVNTDILLMDDIVSSSRQAAALRETFVLMGQRWDLVVTEALNFSSGWESRLRARLKEQGRLHRPVGSDYFVFPRTCYTSIPDFAIGRSGWDNWMIYKSRAEKWPALDATSSITVIHQEHDYSHLPDGQPHYSLPESLENIRLAGGTAAIRYTVLDATARFAAGKITRPLPSWDRFKRGIERCIRRVFSSVLPEETLEIVARPRRLFRRLKRRLNSSKR
jgi:hypothetical protein